MEPYYLVGCRGKLAAVLHLEQMMTTYIKSFIPVKSHTWENIYDSLPSMLCQGKSNDR